MNISLIVAAGAGLLSFLSPCVLPLVPWYLAFVAGASLGDPRHRPSGVRRGVVVLNALGSTLGVPFLASALAVIRSLASFSRFRLFLPIGDRVAGLPGVGVGLLLALSYMTMLNAYFIGLTPRWLLARR